MAERRPIVNISGQLQELPTGDTVYGASGGSSTIGTFTVDFGTLYEDSFVTQTISEPAVGASSTVNIWPSSEATATHDAEDYIIEKVSAIATTITPGVGFDIVASSASDSNATFGEYSFIYQIIG